MKTVAIVQARVSSTRLPGKVLLDLAGKPMLERQIERLRRCRTFDEILLATTTREEDDPVVSLAERLGLRVYRGSLEDVLDRFYQTAKWTGAEVVARITADCPMIDPVICDQTVELYGSGADYASTGTRLPDGLDTEVLSFSVLETAWKEARLASEREHVTAFVTKNATRFRIKMIVSERDLSAMRWTVDEPADLEFVRQVYARLHHEGDVFHMDDVLALLQKEPRLLEINQNIVRNAGYLKSLAEDRIVK